MQIAGVEGQNCNLVDHTSYDHSSLLATVEEVYGLSPPTQRDAAAAKFSHLLSLSTPREDARWVLPDVAKSEFKCDDDAGNQPSGPTGPLPGAGNPDEPRPISPSMRGFVELAAILTTRIHPTEKAQIARRVQELSTAADARAYLARINEQLQAGRQRLLAGGISPKMARYRRRNRRAATIQSRL